MIKETHIIIIFSLVIVVLFVMLFSSKRDYEELENQYIKNGILNPLSNLEQTLSSIADFLNEVTTNGHVTLEELNTIKLSANNALLFLSDFDQNYTDLIIDNGPDLNPTILYNRIIEVRDNARILSERGLPNNDGYFILNEKEINSIDTFGQLMKNYSEYFSNMLELIHEENLYTSKDFEKSEEWKRHISDINYISP